MNAEIIVDTSPNTNTTEESSKKEQAQSVKGLLLLYGIGVLLVIALKIL